MMNNDTFAERLQNLRKVHGYSQEQLADLLELSRQAVSKWEAGHSQPDIDNLVRLSELYGESLDSIVKGAETTAAQTQPQAEAPTVLYQVVPLWHYEYKSKTTLWGMPLVHVNLGRTSKGRLAVAKGVIAVGSIALGLLSVGVFSLGLLSIGVLALGLLVLGMVGVGVVSCGVTVAGVCAFGVVAFGYLAVGVTTVGIYSGGIGAVASQVAVGVAASAGQVAIGREQSVAPHTLLVDASTTAEAALAYIETYAPATPGWIAQLLAMIAKHV